MSFTFCQFLFSVLLGGKGRGEQAAVWCLVASCWVKLQHSCVWTAHAIVLFIYCLLEGPIWDQNMQVFMAVKKGRKFDLRQKSQINERHRVV